MKFISNRLDYRIGGFLSSTKDEMVEKIQNILQLIYWLVENLQRKKNKMCQ